MRLRARGGYTLGFTLIEILVSLALGGLLLAGAFELHITFNRQSVRQQQIVEMQQTLRVARQVIERALRGAGKGLQGGNLMLPNCQLLFPVQFHNINTYPGIIDANPNDNDLDPDWIQIVTAADTTPTVSCPGGACGGSMPGAGQPVSVLRTQSFNNGDFVVAVDSTTPPILPPTKVDCVMQINAVNAGANCGPGANCGTLTYAGACGNCLGGIPYPAPVRLLNGPASAAPAMTIFRVEPLPTIACPNGHCLMASYTAINAAANWQLVAENVWDLQFAFIMSDGRVCGTQDPITRVIYSTDDPNLCDPRSVKAIRFSITARSAQPARGFNGGQYGNIEDELLVVINDGYLRRTVTAEVQVRNNP